MSQTTEEVIITYETLYEMLRKEKSRQELQGVDASFFVNVLNYLRDKQKAYDETLSKDDIFSQGERDKLHIQLVNIKKILRDLYDLRERKILNMATNSSRTKTMIVDTSNILPQEKSLYNSLTTVLSQHRSGLLSRLVELREPELAPFVLPFDELEPTVNKVVEETQEIKDKKNVKFTEQIEQFVGEELEMYGPYSAEDIAELPISLADILISQGKAMEL